MEDRLAPQGSRPASACKSRPKARSCVRIESWIIKAATVGVGVLAATAIVSRLQLCFRPPAISAVCCGGWIGSAPRAAGNDRRNCPEGAATPPHRFRWGRLCVGHEQLGLEFAIIFLAADLAVAFPRKRAGRRDKAGPGQPSMALDELDQLFSSDAAVARVHSGSGGRRGLIGRSRCPTRRCTGRSPRASAQNTKAHGELGRRCSIDLSFRASPVNGKTFDGRTFDHSERATLVRGETPTRSWLAAARQTLLDREA